MSNFSLNGSGPGSNLNNAGVFNGTSTKGTTSLANVPTSAFSVGIWVNAVANASSGFLFDNGNPNNANKGFDLIQPGNASNVSFQFFLGNGTTTALTGTGTISASTWHCLVFTYDGTTLTPYVDGSAGGTTTLAGPVVNNGTNTIGFGEQMPPDSGNWYAINWLAW
jgi:Concanavalin A-like lectin/glucanases superfamily